MLILDIETISQPGLVPPEMEAPANLKDPEKITAAIQKKRTNWIDSAALSAESGQVALVGLRYNGDNTIFDKSETQNLALFWAAIKDVTPIVTFNGNKFDLPFLIRRSIILGVPWPHDIFDRRGYLDNNRFVDLLSLWQCGDRTEYISLDRLAQIILGKSKESSGADFGRLWVEDRQKAIDHLTTDLELTEALAQRMLL